MQKSLAVHSIFTTLILMTTSYVVSRLPSSGPDTTPGPNGLTYRQTYDPQHPQRARIVVEDATGIAGTIIGDCGKGQEFLQLEVFNKQGLNSRVITDLPIAQAARAKLGERSPPDKELDRVVPQDSFDGETTDDAESAGREARMDQIILRSRGLTVFPHESDFLQRACQGNSQDPSKQPSPDIGLLENRFVELRRAQPLKNVEKALPHLVAEPPRLQLRPQLLASNRL